MTQADRTARLVQHARTRHEQTVQRAQAALTALASGGGGVTVSLLASKAAVSRSWIYTQPALRGQIEQLGHDPPRPGPSGGQAASSRASAESLRRRLALAHQQIQQLRNENQQLRQSLACAHGQLRAASTQAQVARDDRA
jgi:Family of unknown function (DUF6262)